MSNISKGAEDIGTNSHKHLEKNVDQCADRDQEIHWGPHICVRLAFPGRLFPWSPLFSTGNLLDKLLRKYVSSSNYLIIDYCLRTAYHLQCDPHMLVFQSIFGLSEDSHQVLDKILHLRIKSGMAWNAIIFTRKKLREPLLHSPEIELKYIYIYNYIYIYIYIYVHNIHT